MCTKENLEMQEEGCTTLAKRRRRKNDLKFSSTKQLHRAKMERQMGRVTLSDIKVTACLIVFHTIGKIRMLKSRCNIANNPLFFERTMINK